MVLISTDNSQSTTPNIFNEKINILYIYAILKKVKYCKYSSKTYKSEGHLDALNSVKIYSILVNRYLKGIRFSMHLIKSPQPSTLRNFTYFENLNIPKINQFLFFGRVF